MKAAELAAILRKLGEAHYEAADAILELASETPGSSRPVTPGAGAGTPAPDLPSSQEERDYVFARCPVHDIPWVVKEGGISKNGKPYKAFWKCKEKNADGSYCNKKPDPSWARAHDAEQALMDAA